MRWYDYVGVAVFATYTPALIWLMLRNPHQPKSRGARRNQETTTK